MKKLVLVVMMFVVPTFVGAEKSFTGAGEIKPVSTITHAQQEQEVFQKEFEQYVAGLKKDIESFWNTTDLKAKFFEFIGDTKAAAQEQLKLAHVEVIRALRKAVKPDKAARLYTKALNNITKHLQATGKLTKSSKRYIQQLVLQVQVFSKKFFHELETEFTTVKTELDAALKELLHVLSETEEKVIGQKEAIEDDWTMLSGDEKK